MITENVSSLQIHKLSQAQYNAALAAGTLNENALYLTPDADGTAIPTKVSDLENDSGYVTADAIATATGTASGIVKLSDAIDSDSCADDGVAATPFAVKNAIVEASMPAYGSDLSVYTWEQIAALSKKAAVAPSDYAYLIGQTKDVLIEGYGAVPFQVVAIGNDTLADGTTAGFTFQSVPIITKRVMNSNNTNVGGWASTDMRTYLNETIYNAVESSVKLLMKLTSVKYYATTSYTNISTCNDYMWLPSSTELGGGTLSEGAYYQYYAENSGNNSRIKNDTSGTAIQWWTRTAVAVSGFGNECFNSVYTSGAVGYSSAWNTYGVAPCFCI